MIVENAEILSKLDFNAPVIVAGNKCVSDKCRRILVRVAMKLL